MAHVRNFKCIFLIFDWNDLRHSLYLLLYYDVTGLLHCYAIPAILEHLKLP